MNIKSVSFGISLVALTVLSGCSNMTTTQQRTLSGASIGAVGGAVIGAATGGNIATGAAIGAGVGGLGGYLYDQSVSDYYYR